MHSFTPSVSYESSLLLRDFFHHDLVPQEVVNLLSEKMVCPYYIFSQPTPHRKPNHLPIQSSDPGLIATHAMILVQLPTRSESFFVPYVLYGRDFLLSLSRRNLETLLYQFKSQSLHQLTASVQYLSRHTQALSRILPLTCTSYHDILQIALGVLMECGLIPRHTIRFIHDDTWGSSTSSCSSSSFSSSQAGTSSSLAEKMDQKRHYPDPLVFHPHLVPYERYFYDSIETSSYEGTQTELLHLLASRLSKLETMYITFIESTSLLLDPEDRKRLATQGAELDHPLLHQLMRVEHPPSKSSPTFTIRMTSQGSKLYVRGAHHARQVIGPSYLQWLFLKKEWLSIFWKRLELHWVSFFYRWHYRNLAQALSADPHACPRTTPFTEAWSWTHVRTPLTSDDPSPLSDGQPDFPPSLTSTAEIHPMLWVQSNGSTWLWTSAEMCIGILYEPVESSHVWKPVWEHLIQLNSVSFPDKMGAWKNWFTIIIMDLLHIVLRQPDTLPSEEHLVKHWDQLRPTEEKENRNICRHDSQGLTRHLYRKLLSDWATICFKVQQRVGPWIRFLHWDDISIGAYRFEFQHDPHGFVWTLRSHLHTLVEKRHLSRWKEQLEMEREQKRDSRLSQSSQSLPSHSLSSYWDRLKRYAWLGSTGKWIEWRLQGQQDNGWLLQDDLTWLLTETKSHGSLSLLHSAASDLFLLHAMLGMLMSHTRFQSHLQEELEKRIETCTLQDSSPLTLVVCQWFETFAPGSLYHVMDTVQQWRSRMVTAREQLNQDHKGIPLTRGRARRTRTATRSRGARHASTDTSVNPVSPLVTPPRTRAPHRLDFSSPLTERIFRIPDSSLYSSPLPVTLSLPYPASPSPSHSACSSPLTTCTSASATPSDSNESIFTDDLDDIIRKQVYAMPEVKYRKMPPSRKSRTRSKKWRTRKPRFRKGGPDRSLSRASSRRPLPPVPLPPVTAPSSAPSTPSCEEAEVDALLEDLPAFPFEVDSRDGSGGSFGGGEGGGERETRDGDGLPGWQDSDNNVDSKE